MTVRRERRIAILGAGIMGCSLALLLARRGARVTLIDRATEPFGGASRWNEGKIHLGFLYAGDPSLETARKLIPGGLAFRPIVEELVGRSIESAIASSDDFYLTHRDSIVDAAAMAGYLTKVMEELKPHDGGSGYLSDIRSARLRTLAPNELSQMTTAPEILAGFQVPERSVQTARVADWFIDAVRAEPRIESRFGCRVTGLAQEKTGWRIEATPAVESPHEIVINALWEGRAAIDRAAGLGENGTWSYRYRLSLFARAAKDCHLPNALIATGPFGDIKNYNGRDLYLSWYPAGLLADLSEPDEGVLPHHDASVSERLIENTVTALTRFFPAVRGALDGARIAIGGGWIVAPGGGSLADPGSDLHRRDRFGVSRHGSYISVDTGKYSTAPWLASRIAEQILG
jgi:glycine/D-amino acid oxidase-like deaminating enzyme